MDFGNRYEVTDCSYLVANSGLHLDTDVRMDDMPTLSSFQHIDGLEQLKLKEHEAWKKKYNIQAEEDNMTDADFMLTPEQFQTLFSEKNTGDGHLLLRKLL